MLSIGAEFAHYRIEALLGEGGMGQVYRAFDEKLHRRVALKVLAVADATSAQRMVREARAAAALEHPNKVSVFELGEVDGTPYLAMELITGPTLRATVGDRSVPWQDVVGWLMDVARALDAAHAAGLVHRDIKPDNVMLREDGVVKVLDFGIARRTTMATDSSAPTAAAGVASVTGGTIAGTAAYMAPEQVRGDELDGRCDQFAWGVMAFELLTGEHPWGGSRETLALLSAMLTKRPRALADVRPDLPSKLSEVLARALASDRADRYASMRALVNDVAPLVGQSERAKPAPGATTSGNDVASARTEMAPLAPSTSAPASVTRADAPTSRRAAAIGVAGLALVIVAVVAMRRSREDATAHAARASMSAPLPSTSTFAASNAPASSASASSHVPVWPCANTKRPKPAAGLDRTCPDETEAWCNQSMRVVACCAKGLVADGDEGACGCPNLSATEASKRPVGCPASTLPETTTADLRQVVRAHFDEMRQCYARVLARVPTAGGKVAVWFEIDPAGEIFFARVDGGTLPDATAQKCVLGVFRGLHFAPPNGGTSSVLYPITFSPGE